MAWLLSGVLALLGLVLLGVVVRPLPGRISRGQAAAQALRTTLEDGAAQLRSARGMIQDWRAIRGGGGGGRPSA